MLKSGESGGKEHKGIFLFSLCIL